MRITTKTETVRKDTENAFAVLVGVLTTVVRLSYGKVREVVKVHLGTDIYS